MHTWKKEKVIFISSDENIVLDSNTNVLYKKVGSSMVYKKLFQQLIRNTRFTKI